MRVASLLQVDRSHVKVIEDAHSGKDMEPVTMNELLRHTMPLQSQLDDLKARVSSLETTVEKHHPTSTDEDESGRRPDESGNNEVRDEPDRLKQDDRRIDEEESPSSINNEEESNDPRDNEDGKTNRGGKGHGNKLPDWNGVAPPPHWNGLEEVKAVDHGPKASWKGNGTGVSSGLPYSGEYPYDIMMDVDYVIDSNPATGIPTTTRGPTPAPKSEGKSQPKKHPKAQRKHGGKTSPSAPRVSPKSSPIDGGKSNAKPRNSPKSSPKRGGKSGRAGKESGPAGKGKGDEGRGGKNNPVRP